MGSVGGWETWVRGWHRLSSSLGCVLVWFNGVDQNYDVDGAGSVGPSNFEVVRKVGVGLKQFS